MESLKFGEEHKNNPQLLLNVLEDAYRLAKGKHVNGTDAEWAIVCGAVNRFARKCWHEDLEWKYIADNLFMCWQCLRRLLDLHAKSYIFNISEKKRVKREYDSHVADLIQSIVKWRKKK